MEIEAARGHTSDQTRVARQLTGYSRANKNSHQNSKQLKVDTACVELLIAWKSMNVNQWELWKRERYLQLLSSSFDLNVL